MEKKQISVMVLVEKSVELWGFSGGFLRQEFWRDAKKSVGGSGFCRVRIFAAGKGSVVKSRYGVCAKV